MAPFLGPRLRTLLTVLVFFLCFTAHASPLFLLKQRAGQKFIYEVIQKSDVDYSCMLENEFYSYLYVFTEAMNTMLKDLFRNGTMQSISFSEPSTFDSCPMNYLSFTPFGQFKNAGCLKTLLHAGIAGDCAAKNPLCCVLYWRYPPSLSRNLSLRDIDPRLIFWDGTQAVNGFFTNFSVSYLNDYKNCNTWPVYPRNSREDAGAALAVDSTGKWGFTRSIAPFISFVERRIDAPTAAQTTQFAALGAAGKGVWEKQRRFGNIPIVAPIVVCAALLAVCLVLLLLFHQCTEPPAQKEQAELLASIEALEASTAVQEAEISRRRTRSERRSPSQQLPSGRQTPSGSFAKAPKSSPSPVDLYGSLATSGQRFSQLQLMGMTPSPSVQQDPARALSTPLRSPSNLSGSTALTRKNSLSELQSPRVQAMSSDRRASITADHRRPKKQDSPSPQQQQQALPRVSSSLSRVNSFGGGQSSHPPSRTSSARGRMNSMPLSGPRSPESFQNPLIGRQSFRL